MIGAYMAKTQGHDFNYFQRLSISNTTFSSSPDITIPFRGVPSIFLVNEGSNTIQYSFNGLTVHGDLVPGTLSSALAFNGRGQSLIWFKLPSGAASTIRVETFDGQFAALGSSTPIGVQTTASSISTTSALSTSFSTGQLAVTGSAQVLGASTAYKNGFALTNLSSSTASMFIGASGVTTTTGFELAPGTSLILPVQDISTVYVIAATAGTTTANWIGFN